MTGKHAEYETSGGLVTCKGYVFLKCPEAHPVPYVQED